MQIQQSIQSGNSDDSYGTHQFENMHPQFNNNGGHYNWGMQQPYWNYNSHLMNSSYPTPSTVPEFPSQQNIGAITSYRPKESHHLQLHAGSSSGTSTSRDSSSYYATDSPSSLPIPKKVNHDKEKYFSDLAKFNEKLSMIDKKINPVDECIEEIDEGIASLPLKNLEELEAFEKILKKDENLKKLIVRKIRLLGKKNSKNSEGDYVQRAWRTVFEDSLSKDVNWLGRRDKRVNGGMGKKGIHSCRITELVRGIISNSKFKDLEKEVFVAETKSYLHNAKGRFVAEQAKLAVEDNSSDSN
ncbi:Uncharacterized protein APZ42_025612 [Daphnia magna]|uniref:DUF4806 domain-containing protein n=1 Tax=Daphnia magna TaxID=35525 RepID=A0A164SWE5_9CRUS|nr:Uncharacterized protein APZ42_025612 [Daphnia magna]